MFRNPFVEHTHSHRAMEWAKNFKSIHRKEEHAALEVPGLLPDEYGTCSMSSRANESERPIIHEHTPI